MKKFSTCQKRSGAYSGFAASRDNNQRIVIEGTLSWLVKGMALQQLRGFSKKTKRLERNNWVANAEMMKMAMD